MEIERLMANVTAVGSPLKQKTNLLGYVWQFLATLDHFCCKRARAESEICWALYF